MRKIFFAAAVVLSALNTHAVDNSFADSLASLIASAQSAPPAETLADSAVSVSVIDATQPAADVTIAAVPAPVPVLEVRKLEDPIAKIRKAKKLKLTKKKVASKVLLTRIERRRVELLGKVPASAEQQVRSYSQNEEHHVGSDKLDLHRSYSFPKLVSDTENTVNTGNASDDESAVDGLSSHVRVRLLMARIKALETHVLAKVPDTEEALSDNVMARLKEARLKAVAAHQKIHA